MIRTARDGALWQAIIDRPDKANSVTGAMLAELADFAEAAQGNAKVLVLSGTGKVFSAGADLEAAKAGLATDPVWERLSAAIARFDGLSIAALNGTLAGGAFGMALACDLRIAVEGAKFFYPVMKLGFLPQPSDPARLAALVGPARAKLILMGAAKLTTPEALTFGLVDRIVARDDLDAEVAELSQAALEAEPSHIAGIKALTRA
ncbi:enoyl-CoA hydratase/isomerase family protein [Meridianimarinicoccus aquatilis]|uniref:Enoyl-CoA hydratase/isomerase family protein n=1 Tax=Meridianimarinicoccus aquatilis TaxID=2552766 RepID=A0A4R6AYM8_9RHOB|nr:enoyl-CoA hydratase/isomerase family protein [Fluviibacterium aquatile]TDL89370.1 enoyl-CoA hydratase/isomerase family protein [Fluviibacterium aquatile]